MNIRKIFIPAILSIIISGQVFAQKKEMIVEAYYFDGISQLDSFDMKKLTHLIFCFGHLDGSRYKVDDAKDSMLIKKMVSMKTINPKLKVILSLGGWGGCETCSDAFFTPEGRREFAQSVKQVNDYFKTDGIDLDWEYPTIRLDNDIDKNPVHKTAPEDRKNFTDLVQQLRKTLGKKMTISFAAGGFQTFLEKSIEWKEVMKEVDFVNLMMYDLINGYATETGHQTALYSTPKQHESTDNAVRYLIKQGINPQQIVIGSAFYARVWENVGATNNGLYQQGKFKTSVPFSEFANRLSPAQGYEYHWDSTAMAPYMYNPAEKTFATFDDVRSIQQKTKYAIDKKLAGIMFWELSHDIHINGMVDAINRIKNRK